MAVEYVKGESLDTLLRRDAPLARKEALSLFLPICEAVSYAHQNGILHGDLRPRNVLIAGDGTVKVTDFSVANAFQECRTTLPETIPDAARYVAPEVAQGEPVSVYSDLYSLGVVLYQMLTATVPFDGKSPSEVLEKHVVRQPPPPSNFNPTLSPAIEEVILKLLDKDPKARYPSVSHLIQELRKIEGGGRIGQPVPQWENVTLQRPKRASAREQIAPPRPSSVTASGTGNVVWSLATILASFLLMFGAYFLWVATTPKDVVVPNVTGLPMEEAKELMESVGLSLVEARREFHSEIAENCVISTVPAAGRKVKEGRTVNAIVSSGQELVTVPDLRDMPLEKARKVLSQASLAVGKVQEVYNPIIASGYVVAHMPGPSERVPKKTPVWLQVSRGPEPTIPATQPKEGASLSPRRAEVIFDVPPGPPRQEVKIVVHDAQGERTVYQQLRSPGDRVEETIELFGEKAIIRVYLAGNLIAEEER
jgi:serine/threonine-protein kinase